MIRTTPDIHRYWDTRARTRARYRGEDFYTVTSIPLYINRRDRLLVLLARHLEQLTGQSESGIRLLDFGCGDGKYSIWLRQRFRYLDVVGCDLSESMIEIARANAKSCGVKVVFARGDSRIPFETPVDIVLINAVLAHVEDTLLRSIVVEIAEHLKPQGHVLLFEATTCGVERRGRTWNRRSENFYISLFEGHGFELDRCHTVSYPFFTRVDRLLRRMISIARAVVRRTPRTNNLNTHWWYVRMSEVLIRLSAVVDTILPAVEGNTFYVFRKTSTSC